MNPTHEEFLSAVTPVIRLLEQNDHAAARASFNAAVYPKFKNGVGKDILPRSHRFFFSELDEYLNSENARLTGAATREKVLDSFYSDIARMN